MSQVSQFSLKKLGWRSDRFTNLTDLFGILPFAALLVDAHKGRVLAASQMAVNLCQRNLEELLHLDIQKILPDWKVLVVQSDEITGSSAMVSDRHYLESEMTTELNFPGKTTLPIKIILKPLPGLDNQILVVLNPSTKDSTRSNTGVPGISQDVLSDLSLAIQQTDLANALQALLQAGQVMTQSNFLAIYTIAEKQPVLQRITVIGNTSQIPGELPLSELRSLQTPQLWLPGSRSTVSLHRTARGMNFKYMVSTPLGQSEAMIGLLIFAGSQSDAPKAHLLSVVTFFGALITQLIRTHSLEGAHQEQLNEINLSLRLTEYILNNTQEGWFHLTPQLKIENLNRPAVSILGYSRREVLGHPIDRVLIGSEILLSAIHTVLVGRQTQVLNNIKLYRRNGSVFSARVRLLPLSETDLERKEHLSGISLLFQDISDAEQSQEQIQQLEQRAMLGNIIAVFAHEVRNPINNISTGLELLAYNLPTDDPNQETIRRMLQDCDRLSELMKSVLAYTKPAEYKMEKLELSLLIQRLVERLKSRLDRVQVKYTIQLEPELPPVMGNAQALEQVFNNLINNAIQAMSESGGHLAIKVQHLHSPTETGRDQLQISIADTGPGIPPEIQEKIFKEFYSTRLEGTGLGLTIAKRIVTLHQGTIHFESFPGGTVFRVNLPVAE